MSDFRKAIHVGDLPFGAQSGDVYYSMNDDFMQSERETIEFLLEKYPVKPSSHYYVDSLRSGMRVQKKRKKLRA